MGLVTTEQTTAIIDSVAGAIDAAMPDTVVHTQPDPNYWWLLWIGLAPVIIVPILLWFKKKFFGSPTKGVKW